MGPALSARRRLLAVLCGGFCGTITRSLLSTALQSAWGKGWPYDILLINVTGAFVLALVTTLADATFLVGPTRRLFLNVGFLGAYTTFSSLALGDVLLLTGQQWGPAVLYVGTSLVGGMVAVVGGDLLGQTLIRVAHPARSVREKDQGAALGESLVPTDAAASSEHLDLEDDLLVSASGAEDHDNKSTRSLASRQ
ncbi:MAG: CrcB family protein [Ktedonobacteraceae bacterium]|nr:CrcB family protein [Ktedonobacteraceae bacterium]